MTKVPRKNAQPVANGTGGQGDADNQNPAGPNSESENGSTVKNIAGLEVSSTVDGYRRAGRAWTKVPTFVPLSDLTADQIEQLEDDANIIVHDAERPAAADEE